MPRRPLRLLAALMLMAPPAFAGTEVLRQEAIAYARKGDTVLYRESHWRYRQEGVARRLVLYRCPDGRAFARKTVVERPAAQAPDFDFEDARDGYREGVRTGPGGRVVYVRDVGDARPKERTLSTPPGAVIDAGFDGAFLDVMDAWQTFQ